VDFETGDILVTEHGAVVMLTVDGLVTGEMSPNGAVPSYYEGISLLSGGRWRGKVVRKVGTIRQALQMLEASGIDLKTPATKNQEQLTDRELLQQVLADNAALKAQIAKQK
jgi:hypothetical protein